MDRKTGRGLFAGVATLMGCLLIGCVAQTPPAGPRVRAHEHVGEAGPSEKRRHATAEQVVDEPTGEMTLRQALALALVHNPELTAHSFELRAHEARVLQAGVLPNPEISVEVENFGGSGEFSGTDVAETTVSLSQLVELGGKRARRRRVAELERDLAGWDYETARIDVLTRVAEAFVNVLAAQERVTLAAELVRAGEAALAVVERQVEAGAVSTMERGRAQVAIASSLVDLERQRRALSAARDELSLTWGRPEAPFSNVLGALAADLERPPSVSELIERVDANPDLARWATELSARRATVELEQSRRIPDVTLGGGPRWHNVTDDNAFVFQVAMPLPLFDRNQGAAEAARHDLGRAEQQRQAAELRVHVSLTSAHGDLVAAYADVTSLRDDVLPIAERAYEDAASAYRRGVFRHLELLDAQRTLFALRRDYIESLARYRASLTRVERLVGGALGYLVSEDGR